MTDLTNNKNLTTYTQLPLILYTSLVGLILQRCIT